MNTTRFLRMWTVGTAIAALSLAALPSAPAHAAFLEGKTLTVDLERRTNIGDDSFILNSPVTVGPGVELEDFGIHTNPDWPALVDIDLADTKILITLVMDQPPANLQRIRFIDTIGDILPFESVTVDPSTNWAGFDSGRLGGSSQNGISVSLGQLSGLAGQFVLLNVIPEPTAAALALPALAVLALARRGRRES